MPSDLADEMNAVRELLRVGLHGDGCASDKLAGQEALLQTSLSALSARNSSLQYELIELKEKLANALKGGKRNDGPPPSIGGMPASAYRSSALGSGAHRPAPPRKPDPAQEAALNKYGSAEYNASAPHPPAAPPPRRAARPAS